MNIGQRTVSTAPAGSAAIRLPGHASPPPHPIKALIAYYTAWNAHDAAAIIEMLGPRATYEGTNSGGRLSGQSLVDYLNALWVALPDLRVEIESLDQYEREAALGRWTLTGTNIGPIFGLSPTGRSIRLAGADFFRFRDGRIASVSGHFDAVEMLRQLGLRLQVSPVRGGERVSMAAIAASDSACTGSARLTPFGSMLG